MLLVSASGVPESLCLACPYADKDPAPRAAAAATAARKKFHRPPCAHLGPPTGETLPCKECGKEEPTQVPVMICWVHGECSERKLVNRPGEKCLAACRACPDYVPVATSPPAAVQSGDPGSGIHAEQ
jgi:hypothetical protein